MPSALAGFRVIDLSSGVAGSICTKFLADFGADVIKVESPAGGDAARRLPPFVDDDPSPERSAYFNFLNTNKRSVTIDFSTPTGAALLRALVRGADVVVETEKPDTLEGRGLGYDALRGENPGLVMTSITPFGLTGPYRKYEATGLVVLAMGGLTYVTGDPDREPLTPPGYQAEAQAGMYAWISTLSALYERRTSGVGQHLDISQMEAVLSNLESTITMYTFMGLVRGHWYSRQLVNYPGDIYPCRDGWIVVVLAPRSIDYLAALTQDLRLLEPRFKDTPSRIRNADEFDAIITAWTMQHTRADIFKMAQDASLNFSPVSTPADIAGNPQFNDRGFFRTVAHPVMGDVPTLGLPMKLSATPWQYERSAPLLGADSRAVLTELAGCDDAAIARLRESGVV